MGEPTFSVGVSSDSTATFAIATTREVHKFGGPSLADIDGFLQVGSIISDHCGHDDVIVVSAAGDTTDRLITFVDLCGSDPRTARNGLSQLFDYQLSLVNRLLVGNGRDRVRSALWKEFTWMRGHINEVVGGSLRSCLIGHGEVWSARLLAALLNQFGLLTEWLDARTVLRAETGLWPEIDDSPSRQLVQHAIQSLPGHRVIITGFVASNEDGQTVLLGRNGSDYSATTIGNLVGSAKVTIWSDEAGVHTADPVHVDSARLVPTLSFCEAHEMASLGAPVLHRRSLQSDMGRNVPITLRSSHAPDSGSTTIERNPSHLGSKLATLIDGVALFAVSSPSGESCEKIKACIQAALGPRQLHSLIVESRGSHGAVRYVFPKECADDAKVCIEQSGFTVVPAPGPHSMLAVIGAAGSNTTKDRDTFLRSLVDADGDEVTPALVVASDFSFVAIVKDTDVKSLLSNVHTTLIDNA